MWLKSISWRLPTLNISPYTPLRTGNSERYTCAHTSTNTHVQKASLPTDENTPNQQIQTGQHIVCNICTWFLVWIQCRSGWMSHKPTSSFTAHYYNLTLNTVCRGGPTMWGTLCQWPFPNLNYIRSQNDLFYLFGKAMSGPFEIYSSIHTTFAFEIHQNGMKKNERNKSTSCHGLCHQMKLKK